MTADEFNAMQHEHAKRVLEKHFDEMNPQTTIEYTAQPDGMVLKVKGAKVKQEQGHIQYETINGAILGIYYVPDRAIGIGVRESSYGWIY